MKSTILLILACGVAAWAQSPFNVDAIVARSKPAIFKILAGAQVDTDYPLVNLKRSELGILGPGAVKGQLVMHNYIVQIDADRDWSQGKTKDSPLVYEWALIASDPGKYLESSGGNVTIHQDKAFASGSGFAITEDGVLLTNAHVVAAPDSDNLEVVYLGPYLDHIEDSITGALGGGPPRSQTFQEKLAGALANWLVPQGRTILRHTEIRVTTQFFASRKVSRSALDNTLESWQSIVTGVPATDGWKENSEPADVLSVGKPGTAQDVAVLRMHSSPQTLQQAFMVDRFLCLPLGDSDEVHNPIEAMGFPARVRQFLNEDFLARSPQVIVHSGTADAVDRADGRLLHMTADTSHGDSGGPIIDAHGNVVGLNALGYESENYAIPINTAKMYLARKGITPRVGADSKKWFAAQDAFAQQHYATAYRDLDEIEALMILATPKLEKLREEHVDLGDRPKVFNAATKEAILALAKLCVKRISEGRDQSSLLDKAWYRLNSPPKTLTQ